MHWILSKTMGLLAAPLLLAAPQWAAGDENASNHLAKANNTDLRWQYLDQGSGRINDLFLDGAFMASDRLKVKYDLHYWETDLSGSSERHWESAVVKGIYFPKEGAWEQPSTVWPWISTGLSTWGSRTGA